MTDDLWPTDLMPTLDDLTEAPVAVLRKQAAALSIHTGKRIRGEVKPIKKTSPGGLDFAYTFDLFVPGLNYRYELLSIGHGIHGYPIYISANSALMNSLSPIFAIDRNHYFGSGSQTFVLNSLDNFTSCLASIFRDDFTRGILRSLLAQLAAESNSILKEIQDEK